MTATRADVPVLSRVLADAFADYPLAEWLVGRRPGSGVRRGRYYALFLEHGIANGVVLRGRDSDGAAIWFPPGAWKVGAAELLRTLPEWLRITGGRALASRLRGLHWLAQKRPTHEAWVLEVLGVHPESQRRGVGSRLLTCGLEWARADGVGTYLLTANSTAIPFYARHGFAVQDECKIPGGPPIWSLWLEP